MPTLGLFRNKKNSDEAKAVGAALRDLRIKAGLSIRDVGKIVKIDRASVLRHEQGKTDPSARTYFEYAKAYGVGYHWLLWKLLVSMGARFGKEDT